MTVLRRSALLLLLCACAAGKLAAQAAPELNPAPDPTATTIRAITREVVVDVVAVDRHEHNLTDLRQDEFTVFEIGPDRRRTPQKLTSVRFIPPGSQPASATADTGLHVRLGSGCAEATTPYYRLVYRVSADQIRDGTHTLALGTSRAGAKLSYGSHYVVAGNQVLAAAKPESEQEVEARLLQAACYHSEAPLALPLLAQRVQLRDADTLHYQLTIPAPAVPLLALSMNSREVQLEYAACSFDRNSRPLRFLHTDDVRTLKISEYVQATVHGLPSFLKVDSKDHPAAIRFVVRDRRTGNAGAVLVETADALPAGQLTPDEAKAVDGWYRHKAITFGGPDDDFPVMGPVGSFGSLEPRAGAMCGDVYELKPGTDHLPNFWSLDSIGTLYADVLDVPHQQFGLSGGLPGITRSTEWFGIDYHGAFQVNTPGVYEFGLLSDDGAKLYIDDQLVVDSDSIHNVQTRTGKVTLQVGPHTLHVPYFQGPLRSLGLQLFVKAPGGERRLFDIRDYSTAANAAAPKP